MIHHSLTFVCAHLSHHAFTLLNSPACFIYALTSQKTHWPVLRCTPWLPGSQHHGGHCWQSWCHEVQSGASGPPRSSNLPGRSWRRLGCYYYESPLYGPPANTRVHTHAQRQECTDTHTHNGLILVRPMNFDNCYFAVGHNFLKDSRTEFCHSKSPRGSQKR